MTAFTLWLWACTTPEIPAPPPPPEIERMPVAHHGRTTRGDLALKTLDVEIASLLGGGEAKLDVALDRIALRMSLTGRTSDLDRMISIAPKHARVLLAAHRFDEAVAADSGVGDSVSMAREQELDVLLATRLAAVEKRPDAASWMRLGDVRLTRGEAAEADLAYAKGLALYTSVSPLTVADLQFRRGLAWGESGADPERARALYADAVKRLPQFVRAQVHLAELEHDAGDVEAAVRRVRKVADAEDPEPGGKLAVWLEGEEAAVWRAKTEAAYTKLLAKHPLAYADHAAEFYLAVGSTEDARKAARANLDNRNTARARELCERAGCQAL